MTTTLLIVGGIVIGVLGTLAALAYWIFKNWTLQ